MVNGNDLMNIFNKGDILEFRIYGTTVKGEFIREDGSLIYIKTTQDFFKDSIGQEQSINKDFLINQ